MKKQTTEEWIQEAEEFKKSGKKRSAAACYLRAFRRCFYDESDINGANKALLEALRLLEPQEISMSMVAKRYLLTFFTGKIPDPVDEKLISDSERHFYLVLWRYYFENNPEPGIALFRKRWRDRREALTERKKVYLLHTLYFYAVLLNQSGEYDRGLKLIRYLVETLSTRSDLMSRILNAQCFTTLANYYGIKNQNTIAENLHRKAYDLVEPLGLYLYTANVYYEAASFYSSVYGGGRFLAITEKVLEVTKAFSASPQALYALYRIGYNNIYGGDLKEFWSYVEQLKYHSLRYRRPDSLANAYLLEGVYYFYNKNYRKAESIFQKGFQSAKSAQTINLLQRCRIVNYLLYGKKNLAFEHIQKAFFDKEEYGFRLFVALNAAQTPKAIAEAFRDFDADSVRWREESALIFCEKIAAVDPAGFERFCRRMVSDFSKSSDVLSLALVYEALAKFYRFVKDDDHSRFFLEKSVTIYRRIGLNHAASVLSEKFALKNLSLKRYENNMSHFVRQSTDRQLKSDFVTFRRQYEQDMDELGTYRTMLDVLRGIDYHCEVDQLLEQILRNICDALKAENGHIGFYDEAGVLHSACYGPRAESAQFPIGEWANEGFHPSKSPGIIRKTMYLEQGQKIVIALQFKPLLKERQERSLIFFLNEVEPIFELLVRSTLTFGKSIVDSLTQLNNRWFMEQRLQEEFEKSIRYNFPLSFVMADIDDFKKINDTFGHPIGDESLRIIGAFFRQLTRKYDVAARYGGEEFAIILPNTEPDRAFLVAEKIRKGIEEMSDFPFHMTISFGIAGTGRNKYARTEDLIMAADRALYEAKAQGKNRTVVFDHPLPVK